MTPRRPTPLWAALALVSLFGCRAGTPPIATGQPLSPSPSTTCPLGFEGARIQIEDTAEGADVVVVAYGDADEVRRRARDAARMYGPHAHHGLGHDGKHENGQHHGLGLAQLGIAVTASEEDTASGAIIHVAPTELAERDRMREALHARVDRTRTGACP